MKWFEELLKLLASALTKQRLEDAGAGPDALKGAVTTMVELPTFGGDNEPPEGLDESRAISHCEPELARRYLLLKADFEAETGRQLFETSTYRSRRRQKQIYDQGRTTPGKIVTKLDGVTRRSRHNYWPAQAIDVCVDSDPGPGKHAIWDESAYQPLCDLALKHGLTWGGDWNRNGTSDDEKFIDYPHLELPGVA